MGKFLLFDCGGDEGDGGERSAAGGAGRVGQRDPPASRGPQDEVNDPRKKILNGRTRSKMLACWRYVCSIPGRNKKMFTKSETPLSRAW